MIAMEIINIINLTFLSFATYFDCFRGRKINDSLFLFWAIAVLVNGFINGFPNIILALTTSSIVTAIMIIYNRTTGSIGGADIQAFAIIIFTKVNVSALWILLSLGLMLLYIIVSTLHNATEEGVLTIPFIKRELQKPIPFFPFMLGAYIILMLI